MGYKSAIPLFTEHGSMGGNPKTKFSTNERYGSSCINNKNILELKNTYTEFSNDRT
jgi:hypothetical protein